MRTAPLAAAAVAALASAALGARQAPSIRIVSPTADTVVSGAARAEVVVQPQSDARSVNVFVNGRLMCSIQRPPFTCAWDAGAVMRGHHVRAVATFENGRRLVANVRTRNPGYTERVDTRAVLVPVIVTQGGRFVRGLKRQDFEVFEEGVKQPIDSLASEEAPLDLVLAVDISGSMEHALVDVKPAVRQLLSRLRPGDAATLLGFNDTTFLVAEREKDPKTRDEAVELLTSWGGTALYDATVRTLNLVSQEWGRKGVVIFSDGDDRHSLTRRETAMARVRASDAMLYTIGFGSGATVPHLRESLESYAESTGGRPFFPANTRELDGIFDQIVAELANQYVLSYSPTNAAQDGKYRRITVRVRKGDYEIRARRGYQAGRPQRAGR